MRLSLKRDLAAPPRKPLRERLAETRERAGRTLAVARVMMQPVPPAPAPVERPVAPPHADAALLQALDDLVRIDAAQDAIHSAGDQTRDGDTVPGYAVLEAARDDALVRLTDPRAVTPDGLRAKARALTTRSVDQLGGEPFHALAASLARDLLA